MGHDVLATAIEANRTKRGTVFVHLWERDCDCVEVDSLHELPAEQQALQAWRSQVLANAEGPVRMRIISEAEAASFEPSERDRVAEAYENGQGTAVTLPASGGPGL